MKTGLIAAFVVALIGAYFLILGTTDSESVSLLGFAFHPSVARGVGIVGIILSLVIGLGAYGSSLPPSVVERRQQ